MMEALKRISRPKVLKTLQDKFSTIKTSKNHQMSILSVKFNLLSTLQLTLEEPVASVKALVQTEHPKFTNKSRKKQKHIIKKLLRMHNPRLICKRLKFGPVDRIVQGVYQNLQM